VTYQALRTKNAIEWVKAEGRALEAELRKLGVEAEFVVADVRHEKDVRNLVDRAVARFGQLDVAVNNAGTEGKTGPVTDVSAETYSATFDTNVLGILLSLKHELRIMQAQGSGNIVNISSTMGERELRRVSAMWKMSPWPTNWRFSANQAALSCSTSLVTSLRTTTSWLQSNALRRVPGSRSAARTS
jgi:NAD(P)-dependent dehydrogenase (short-subunit alcohol dehydrogenase family)